MTLDQVCLVLPRVDSPGIEPGVEQGASVQAPVVGSSPIPATKLKSKLPSAKSAVPDTNGAGPADVGICKKCGSDVRRDKKNAKYWYCFTCKEQIEDRWVVLCNSVRSAAKR